MEFISDYMYDGEKRAMLNDLTRRTFRFDFEDWVSGGYYTGEYIPYSLAEDGRLLSNVSANIMRFLQDGEQRVYIQLGTVMTDEAHRGQGLARQLIERVLAQYENADGVYLFGNPEALGFYRKSGFEEVREYRYTHKKSAARYAPCGGILFLYIAHYIIVNGAVAVLVYVQALYGIFGFKPAFFVF